MLGFFLSELFLGLLFAVLILIFPRDWRVVPIAACTATAGTVVQVLLKGYSLSEAAIAFLVYWILAMWVLEAAVRIYSG